MTGRESPGALVGATGAEKPFYATAASFSNLSSEALRGNSLAPRISRLRARLGLTLPTAQSLAAVAWEAGNG